MSKLYSFDDHPEHRAQLDAWAQKWIANALSTEPANQPVMIDAINGLYDAANLPRPLAISFVRSPLAMAVAGGVAAGVWWLRANPDQHQVLFGRQIEEGELMAAIAPACEYAVTVGIEGREPFTLASATYSATRSATASATDSATASATYSATDSATASATYSATRSATYSATASATRSATYSATDSATASATASATDSATASATASATYSATASATYSATASATDSATASATASATDSATGSLVAFLVCCTSGWWRMVDGGSDWAAWPAYLSFFDRVAGLDLPIYEKWRHYEAAALNAGPRLMHDKFCIISDRHTEIHLDANNELHREDGPAKVYGDGWSLHYWHGMPVPADFWTWDLERTLAESNSEIRRAGIERLGWDAVIDRLTLVATAPDPGNDGHQVALYDLPSDLQLYDAHARLLVVHNASLDKGGHRRVFGLPVPDHHNDPIAAAADLFGIPPAAYAGTVRAS